MGGCFQRLAIVCSTRHKANPDFAVASVRIAETVARDFGAELLMNRTEVEDLRYLRDAAVRITFSSSFSFYAALASEKLWINMSSNAMMGCRPLIVDLKPAELSHDDVPDYLDVEDVIQRMRRG
jgi:hypothetical protein